MELLSDPAFWGALLTLTALEIVLGIDNVIFISVLASRLPQDRQRLAMTIGLAGALVMRLALLGGIVWLTQLTKPLISLFELDFSARDLILIAGGGFLLVKATVEIHQTIEGDGHGTGGMGTASFAAVVTQIILIDAVFSIDSILTAVGMTDIIPVMVIAIVIAIAIMLLAAGPVSDFIQKHPTTKMLALSFLLLIGMALIADGLQFHIPRGYLYFAIAFSALVEALNVWRDSRRRARNTSEPG
ncbi:MAG: TerC family protein [Alphaproteobacteria bacterium]|nr:TerC family protein [Alphaproteobacteria bacterium]